MSNELENINEYQYINYVDLASIDKDLGIIKEFYKLNPTEASSRARQKIEKGDLLVFSLAGSLKAIAIFDGSFDNAICSTGFYVIKSSKNYNNYYLWALFRSPILQMILERESSGAVMPAINRDAFLNLEIPLPPLSVQNKIAEEVISRMKKAEQLRKEAEEELEKAKKEVEKIILVD
ncbi:MAG: restriction endonuclease subunit S [Candidatus Aenigmatarchaeota archaeon]